DRVYASLRLARGTHDLGGGDEVAQARDHLVPLIDDEVEGVPRRSQLQKVSRDAQRSRTIETDDSKSHVTILALCKRLNYCSRSFSHRRYQTVPAITEYAPRVYTHPDRSA